MHPSLIVIPLFISNAFCAYRVNSGRICDRYSSYCLNGECIPSTSVCDGAIDCSDDSDEKLYRCVDVLCPPYAFRCAYGACVDKSTLCNKIPDCADGSDELLPECYNSSSVVKKCKTYQFQCNSNECIDELLVCDGKKDCIDGSDETITQCIHFRCPEYGFKCAYGGCINKINKCDGTEDCKDGSDEDVQLCHSNVIKETRVTEKTRKKQPQRNCQLPEKPVNGNYEVTDCTKGDTSSKCNKIPGTSVFSIDSIKYSCNPGYVLSIDNKPIVCKNGTWDPPLPSCLKLCMGLYSYSLELECNDQDKKVDCNKPMRPGTKVKATCKDTYHKIDHSAFQTTECLPDGTWSEKLYRCLPDCGKRHKSVRPLMVNAKIAEPSEFPWHAGLYHVGENIEYICGGTIIHPQAILTAAHCVYDDNKTMSPINKEKILVAVGKHWSKWDHEKDNRNVQRFRVTDVCIPDRYSGKYGFYARDIAILRLNKLITLKPTIMPVCLDKEKKFRLDQKINAIGTVVGSGVTEVGGTEVSEELRVARFPLVDFGSCNKEFDNTSISTDKFCAGLSNGTSVQEGDSGSGMTFPLFPDGDELHFIYGIVSHKKLGNEKIAAFTNVSDHMEWIEKKINEIELDLNKLRYNSVTN